MLTNLTRIFQKIYNSESEKDPEEAYDIWSASYDCQSGNLMLDLDELIFSDMIKNIDLENKIIADIGCGTGRHWQKIYDKKPSVVMGFDVSSGMLYQLKCKFPTAVIQQTTDNQLKMVPNLFFDCVVTTLTIAHIKNIEEAIASWSRILKNGGDLFITDFHPLMLAKGGKRSFRLNGKSHRVINYVHPIEKVKKILCKYGLTTIKENEKIVNEEVKMYYDAQNALAIFDRFQGIPIIYGLHLKKKRAAE
jgi:ubiquinone/menaquinone biosynthesis C-methylase UbiE